MYLNLYKVRKITDQNKISLLKTTYVEALCRKIALRDLPFMNKFQIISLKKKITYTMQLIDTKLPSDQITIGTLLQWNLNIYRNSRNIRRRSMDLFL